MKKDDFMKTKKTNWMNGNLYFTILSHTATIIIAVFALVFSRNKIADFNPVMFLAFVFLFPLLVRCFLYMLLGPWYRLVMNRKDARLSASAPDYAPKVSVIVPAYNEEVGIGRTLASLSRSDYDNLEIVVVNDGSKDNTDSVVRAYIDNFKAAHPDSEKSFAYVSKANGGKGRALNEGVRRSSGEIIVTVDADSIVLPDAVSCFVKRFRDPEVMCVAGNITVGNTNTLLGIVQFFEYSLAFYLKKVDSLLNTIFVVGGAAAAYRREVFDTLGLFDEDCITEDIEMSMKIQDAGMKIEFAADAIVCTEGASDLASLMKQRLRWKRGRLDTFYGFRRLFFSAAKRHNKLFTFVTLPLALYSEVELLFDFLIFGVFFFHSVSNGYVTGMLLAICTLSFMFFIVISSPYRKTHITEHLRYILTVWMLLYIATFVEYIALVRATLGFVRKQRVEWQKWERKGLALPEEE
jgi:cellulose synthase/poly-beta-1,6-N-acetylglucosamine synthase-like glycosyltransferase